MRLRELEPHEVKKMHDAGEVVLIDVREPLEYNEEHLAKALLFPSSHFKSEQLPDLPGKKLFFYCHLGRRSAVTAQKWAEHTGNNEAYSLKGGIAAWKEAGFPTVIDSVTGDKIERQTYLMSGISVLAGVVLAYFVSDWFLLIPLVISFLLIIAGTSGSSPLSFLLSMLPWNR